MRGTSPSTSPASIPTRQSPHTDDGIQILDITDPENIVAKASITDGGTLKLEGPRGIAIFESNGSTYAAVASYVDDGVQILDITDPDDIIAKASITDDDTLALDGARASPSTSPAAKASYAAVVSSTSLMTGSRYLTLPTLRYYRKSQHHRR